MLAESEEKYKCEKIKSKQAIMLIVEAWKKMNEKTVKNC